MNKKMILAVIAAIATMSGIAGFNLQKQETNIGALTLANIEALTSSAEESSCHWERKKDGFGCTYHECEPGGSGNECLCGTIAG